MLTKQVVDEIVEAVREGEWPREVGKRLGFSPKTVKAWLDEGEELYDAPDRERLSDHQQLCVELVGLVWIAEAECENGWRQAWLTVLDEARKRQGSGKTAQWQGYCTLLERRFSDRWRKREMARQKDVVDSIESEFRKMSAKDARKELGGAES